MQIPATSLAALPPLDLEASRQSLLSGYAEWVKATADSGVLPAPLLVGDSPLGQQRVRAALATGSASIPYVWDAYRAGIDRPHAEALLLEAANALHCSPQTGLFFAKNSSAGAPPPEINGYQSISHVFTLLGAHAITNDERQLHTADRYAELWADALLNDNAVPLYINANGALADPISESLPSDEKPRARLLIEQHAIDTFLRLYALTATPIYLIVARKLLDIAASDLRTADNGYAVLSIHRYCEAFDDGYFDEYIRIAAERSPVHPNSYLYYRNSPNRIPLSLESDGTDASSPPCPLLPVFYGTLTRRPEFVTLGHRLARAALDTLARSSATPAITARLTHSAIAYGGCGWIADLLFPGNLWQIR